MKKTVSILIPNYNSFDAIQLCIESVRKYTKYPHKIIVHDDRCMNKIDDIYLAECEKKGWIILYSSKKQLGHGGSLNFLLHEVCDTDYAMIMDCDVHIKAPGWLEGMITEGEKNPKTIAVVNSKAGGFSTVAYRPTFYMFWFGLLNMERYNDGMQVDWRRGTRDRRKEPFLTEFADCYPPEKMKLFEKYDVGTFDRNSVWVDPGSWLYLKVRYDNPKGYIVVPVPDIINKQFHHFGHISMMGIPSPRHSEQTREKRKVRFAAINKELRRLRNED